MLERLNKIRLNSLCLRFKNGGFRIVFWHLLLNNSLVYQKQLLLNGFRGLLYRLIWQRHLFIFLICLIQSLVVPKRSFSCHYWLLLVNLNFSILALVLIEQYSTCWYLDPIHIITFLLVWLSDLGFFIVTPRILKVSLRYLGKSYLIINGRFLSKLYLFIWWILLFTR